MLGLVYLGLAYILGYFLVSIMYKKTLEIGSIKSLFGTSSGLSRWVFEVPASFIVGTTFLTLTTYIISYLISTTFLSSSTNPTGANKSPLLYANILIFIYLGSVILSYWFMRKNKKNLQKPSIDFHEFIIKYKFEVILLTVSAIIFTFLTFYTFNISNNNLNLGNSVFSDFGPHVSLIRSFSLGSNFPTQYMHFPDGTIRYHFMFQFLAGNLEFLGLRIDYALNIISILSLLSMILLLYVLTSLITGKKIVGLLCCVLFFFRSSFGFFYYLYDLTNKPVNSFKDFILSLVNTDIFLGKTDHEDWGLFAQNVYANQRHLAFGISAMLIMLIVFYPLYLKMISNLPKFWPDKPFDISLKQYLSVNFIKSLKNSFKNYFQALFLHQGSWVIDNYSRCYFTGIFIGLCAFFNGAVFLASLLILFFMAFFSKHRLEHLITAIISLCIFLIEVSIFTGGGNSDTSIKIGFLAEIPYTLSYELHRLFNIEHSYFSGILYSFKVLPHIFDYYFKLLGIGHLVFFASLIFVPRGTRWLAFAFFSPILMATTLQLTPDIAVNHKYIMIAVILMNIFVSMFIIKIFEFKELKIIAISLVFILTITGFFDLITYYNKNKGFLTYTLNTPAISWIQKNTDPKDVFLTHYQTLNPALVSGRPVYYGWPYFAWSAGYNTDERFAKFKDILGSTAIDTLRKQLKKESISYVFIDDDLNGYEEIKPSNDYHFNRNIFIQNFPTVFEDKQNNVIIVKVQ